MEGKSVNFKNKSFEIKKLLGKGKSGHSYLIKNGGEQYVLKKMHDEPCAYYTFDDKLESELNAYKTLLEAGLRVPELFEHNKQKDYLIKEYIDGETAAEAVARGNLGRDRIDQVLEMTEKLYRKKINIDYFPTNFVINANELVYIDYEFNAYSDEWNFENWGIYYWVNQKGMKEFLEKGNHLAINIDDNSGKPIKEPFEEAVKSIIDAFKKRE